MSGKHAIISPSGFKALMLCPGKPAMEMGLPDQASQYADEGTAAHFLASECLDAGTNATERVWRAIQVGYRAEDDFDGACWSDESVAAVLMAVRYTFKVNDEMAENVQVYLDRVRSKVAAYQEQGATVELLVEQALPIGHITGEDDAEGTGDCVIIASFPDGRTILEVGDLKYGRGVEVSAEDNPQLKLYALGALEKFGLVYDFTEVVCWISQPRVTWLPCDVHYMVEELAQWQLEVAEPAGRAALAIYNGIECGDGAYIAELPGYLSPAEEACRFCKAKATCPAPTGKVQEALGAEFSDLTTADKLEQETIVKTLVADVPVDLLGAKMDAVGLIEDWCKAIRGRVEQQLLAGAPVAGYKLVKGKQGNRAWADEDQAEALLKSMRLKKDEMYDLKLISPTKAEKVLKDSPKRWTKVVGLVTRNDGKPSVAPLSDKRPALDIKPVDAEFTAITEAVEHTGEALQGWPVGTNPGAEDLV